VPIARPALGGLAPAHETLEPQTHQPFVIKFRCKEEQAKPLVHYVVLALLCANTPSHHAISKEAHHLFALAPSEIDVLVHPQSIVHGLVEFRDGSLIAQLGSPDMRIPIAHCLAWPKRISGPAQRLDLARHGTLTFENPDLSRFPALALARRALEAGGGAPTVLNAANEVAVAAFLEGRIRWSEIPDVLSDVLSRHDGAEPTDVDAVIAADAQARTVARELIEQARST